MLINYTFKKQKWSF